MTKWVRQIALAVSLLAAWSPVSASAPAVPVTHGLIVGVSEFTDPELAPYALAGAQSDVARMHDALAQFGGGASEAVVLSGAEASLDRVQGELERLRSTVQSGDRVMLYFSAHGSRIPDAGPIDESDGQDEVLLMADAGEWRDGVLPGALTDDALATAIRGLRAVGADVFLVIDSCASGGAARSGTARQVRSLPPALLAVPERRMRAAQRRDGGWIEDDMPAGSGRLIVFAAGPSDSAAWDTPDGGLFTRSLARAIETAPIDFASLAREQQRIGAMAPQPGPRSEISGPIESAFFFQGALPDLVARAHSLPRPDWSVLLHSAAQADCRTAGPPRELDPGATQRLSHCDAVMLSVESSTPGFFDAWYVDSASGRTLLSPIRGIYLDGQTPAHLSFTFISRDPESGEPLTAGTDRLLLLRRNASGEHDAAMEIAFEVAPDA